MKLPLLAPSLPPAPDFGLLAEFSSAGDLVRACDAVREAGYTKWDAHSPYPIHGLDRAMGLKRSVLPLVVLAFGLGGAAGGFLLQSWVHSIAYPLSISAKPAFAWPAYVPVTFELAVLFGALGAAFGMFALNQLPTFHHPLFSSKRFERVTDDAFFISIESWDPKFDRDATREFLERLGAKGIDLVES